MGGEIGKKFEKKTHTHNINVNKDKMSKRRLDVDEQLLDQISNNFNFRGGYNSYNVHDKIAGGDGDTLLIRENAGTFTNYVSGTVQLVFMIFFVFILISVMTFSLMGYARYLNRRRPKAGFYNPPPMMMRYSKQPPTNTGIYSSLTSRSENTQSRQFSHIPSAVSQQTIDS